MASYKLDQNISVFETNIRILGGLLSAHILALDRRELGITEAFLNSPPHLPYDGKLLDLALDLGDRLIPAFETKTGQRYFTNNGNSPMGFSVAGAMGAAITADKSQNVVCIIGDGGFQMNIQELLTVKNITSISILPF